MAFWTNDATYGFVLGAVTQAAVAWYWQATYSRNAERILDEQQQQQGPYQIANCSPQLGQEMVSLPVLSSLLFLWPPDGLTSACSWHAVIQHWLRPTTKQWLHQGSGTIQGQPLQGEWALLVGWWAIKCNRGQQWQVRLRTKSGASIAANMLESQKALQHSSAVIWSWDYKYRSRY